MACDSCSEHEILLAALCKSENISDHIVVPRSGEKKSNRKWGALKSLSRAQHHFSSFFSHEHLLQKKRDCAYSTLEKREKSESKMRLI
jgi:hypothetical protein